MDDAQILRRLRRQDAAALEAAITRYGAYAAAVVRGRSRGLLRPEDQEEIVSDVFVALWQSAPRISGTQLRPWLGAVARNRTVEAMRRENVYVPLEDDAALTERELMTAIDALPDRISSRETLERVLDTLNEREKGLVQAHFVDGVSCEELAERQNTTIGAIRTALARLRKKARRLAEDERT